MLGAAFDWFNDLVVWMATLVPRWHFVPATHEAVAFVRGKKVVRWQAGAHFYWPPWTTFIQYPVVRQTLDLPAQTLVTRCGKPVIASAVVTFSVNDIVVALSQQFDFEDTILDLCRGVLRSYICERDFKTIAEDRASERCLTTEVREQLAGWGVEVLQVRLTDFAVTQVLSVHGASSVVTVPDEEE